MHALVYTLAHLPDGAERGLEGTELTPRYRYGFDRVEITGELEAVVAHQQSILDAYKGAGFTGKLILIEDGIIASRAVLPPREVLESMTAKDLAKKYGVPKGKKSDMIDRIING